MTTRRNPARGADGRFKRRRKAVRRNPGRKAAPPSHDLFGERTHRTDIFGGKAYIAKPAPKRTATEKKREEKRRAGQTSFDIGLTRSLFG